MKRNLGKRIVSVVLTLVLAVGFLPAMHVHADYEDGMECWYCDHYHWDEYCCGICGGCSPECTNTQCWYTTHCSECGACALEDPYFCTDCRMCVDCYMDNGWHCYVCLECYYTSEEELCGICWSCGDCMEGGLCDSCGFCVGCAELELMHCEECGNCYGSYEVCAFGFDHCEECCVICEQCEECLYEDGIELCDDCGLCVFCCLDNAASEGCSCGEYCVENPDWYDHLCPDCGQAFCEVEMCDLCELCLDCCEGNSDCSETPPVCVEDGDYEFHFCEDCGDCFHNSYICESCEAAGTLLCETCCEIRLEEEGCDCSDRCCSDGDLEQHIVAVHGNGGGAHAATPQSTWEMNETHHWRSCRLCGESSHISNKSTHVYDKFGVCTVCRFDSQKVILILKQPQSVVREVSDVQTVTEEDPLYITNNHCTFSVAAMGTSALQYQWYADYGSGNWVLLKDNDNENIFISGARTNTLEVAILAESCLFTTGYKCVITDAKGNQVTSNVAYMKARHVYRKYQQHKGALVDTIFQPGTGNNIGVYESKGHFVSCVGDGCEEYRTDPHSYHKQTRIVVDSKTGTKWVERICVHCGFKNYILDHEHYFYDPDTYECTVDTTYKNDDQHRLKCLWPGCEKTTLESHDNLGWQNHGTPYSTTDKVGIPYRECQICGYSSEKTLQTYDANTDKMVNAKWNQNNDLVYVEGGYASCDIVVVGTGMVIGFTPSAYFKEEILQRKNPRITGWKVRYSCDRGSAGGTVDEDVSADFTFEKLGDELKWKVTVPSFAGHTGGGILTFTPVIADGECPHTGTTRIKNASQPICTTDGYTGDRVCADCEAVIAYGEVIESSGKHQGKLTLIAGTAKAGSCTERGYEGTFRCSHCNQKVRGKSTAKQHGTKTTVKNAVAVTCTKFGYSGDVYCSCGVLLQEGEILAPRHTNLKLQGAVKATCMTKGYTGDWYCSACKQTVKYGYNLPKTDHAFSKWGKISDTVHRHTCVVAGCGASETETHTDADRNLTCDGCGYSWGSDSPVIRSLTFNIDVPVIGNKPDYTKFNGSCYYSNGTSAYRSNGVEWFDVTANKRFVPGGVNQEFKDGHVYKVTIHFRVQTEYEFVEESAMMATINGRPATVEYVTYGEFAGISYTFEALKHKHVMTRTDKVTPTCTKGGKQTYYHCADCNTYYEDAAGQKPIANLAAWGNLAATGHKASELKSNSTHHFKVCTVCYTEIAGSKAAHSGGTATCTAKARCKDCGVAYGNLADHKLATGTWGFIDPTGHAHLCSVEDCYHRGETVPHRSSGAATETADEVCLDCGFVITPSANHTHVALDGHRQDEGYHWKVCGCGEILEKKAHLDNNEDAVCDICAYRLKQQGADTPDNPNTPTVPDGSGDGTVTTTAVPAGQGGAAPDNGYVIWIVVAAVAVLLLGGGTGFVLWKKKQAPKTTEDE